MKKLYRCWWCLPALLMFCNLAGLLAICLYAERAGSGQDRSREDRYDDLIFEAGRKYMVPGWDWLILKALIKQESGFDPRASNGSAQGLMQFMPGTAKRMGLPPRKRDEPDYAIPAGARYIRRLWDLWQEADAGPPQWNRTRLALASYNAGPGRVRQAQKGSGGGILYSNIASDLPEHTQNHVARVMEYFKEYRRSGRYRKPSGSFRSTRGSIRFWINPMKTYPRAEPRR